MLQRIYPVFLCCVFLAAKCTTANQKVLQDLSVDSEEDIFIDDAQADPIEGSAVSSEFSDLDEGASGMGPDDEDSFAGSGEGSGDRGRTLHHEDVAAIPPPPKKEPVTKKPELPPKTAAPDIPWTEGPTTPSTTTTVHYGPDSNRVPEGSVVPDTDSGEEKDIDNSIDTGVSIMGHKNEDRPTSFFAQPGILAAVIGGAVVGLLCAILLVMFIVYRMRKKDEGSYALDERKQSPTSNSYQRTSNKEFYA